jgi:glycosyltransferase involved in cell wall biosynthesis
MTKYKIVWLCHFSNDEIKTYFNNSETKESAPWISLLIELIEKRSDIELHIVAPNQFINNDSNFVIRNTYYHFYKHLPFLFRVKKNKYLNYLLTNKLYSYFNVDFKSNYFWIKHKIKKIINEIKPDLIHLHGAENPYYSVGILPFIEKYPILVSIQGFIRNANHNGSKSAYLKAKIKVEEEILRKSKYIGIRATFMETYLKQFNNCAKYFWIQYPYKKTININSNEKDCDIVFFGRVCKSKGIEDLIYALSFVVKKIQDVKLRIIGTNNGSYKTHLIKLAETNNIINNIQFIDFLPTQKDLHYLAMKSKICVLPTYDDIYSGTIVESMYMNIPVIAYKVQGLLDLQNETNDSIVFVEKGNIHELANSIIQLLKNVDLQNKLKYNAYKRVNELFDESLIIRNLLNSYEEIINDFNKQ